MSNDSLPPARYCNEGSLALSQIADALRKLEPQRPLVICVDELVVDVPVELAAGDFVLHARVLQCPGPAQIAINPAGESARCRVFVGHLRGPAADRLEIRFLGMRVAIDSAARRFQGCDARWSSGDTGGELRVDELAGLGGDPLVLTHALQAARRLRFSQAEDAIDRALWVAASSAVEPRQARLFSQSVQLLSVLRSPRRGFHLVPYLDRRQYVTQAEALVGALEGVEGDLRVVEDRQYDLAKRQDAARSLLARVDNAARLTEHLLDQAKKNLDAAEEALARTSKHLALQVDAAEGAKKAFDEGLAAYQRRQTALAVFGAILGIGLAIAAVCTANPAGVAAGASAAATAVKEAATFKERVQKIIEVIQKIRKAVEESEKLKQLLDGLGKLRQAIETGQSAAELVNGVRQGWRQMPAGGGSMAAEDWDLLRAELAPLVQPAIDAEVDGAVAYRTQLEKLVIRGKANLFAQQHAIECAQRHQQMVWTVERDQADRATVQAEIAAIQADQPLQWELRSRFEQARDDIKARVVLAIENLTDAHRYFALSEGAARADTAMSTTELRATLARAADDLVQAYEHFNPRPQPWGPYLVPIKLTDERRAILEARGAVSLSVPMTEENFPNYERIRVSQVKAFFPGAGSPAGREIQLRISTGDQFRDRFDAGENRAFDFAGRPVHLGFAYKHRKGIGILPPEGDSEEAVEIVFGGENMAQWDVFFEPTPFTEWQIRLPERGNEGLDLSSCRQIDLYLRGSAVMTGFRMMTARAPDAAPPPLIADFEVDTDPIPRGGGHD